MRIALTIAALTLAVAPALAGAAEVGVSQKDKAFSSETLAVKAGDTVRFNNDDEVAHNVLIKGPSGDKNSGTQKPGEAVRYTFEKAGEHEVRCGIHPKMKLTVTVQ
jgi:plastocyanin